MKFLCTQPVFSALVSVTILARNGFEMHGKTAELPAALCSRWERVCRIQLISVDLSVPVKLLFWSLLQCDKNAYILSCGRCEQRLASASDLNAIKQFGVEFFGGTGPELYI